MKIQIDINESFVQDLLGDTDFLSELSLVHNESNFITELWIKNKIVNNDELTFKTQALEMIIRHYCRINESDPQYLTIVYEGNIPKEVCFAGPKYRLGYLATIKSFENE